MGRKTKLLAWEILCVFWVAAAGSLLHFAFELSDYWTPMALLAAVNESAWEHVKMYFWPGLAFALVQYTYTRDIANNYWLGKAVGLATTPAIILTSYFGYMTLVDAFGMRPSLPVMLAIMFGGIGAGQLVSFVILSMKPVSLPAGRLAAGTYAVLIAMFSTFTYYPPKNFVFENFFCYEYTGEYGILGDYTEYRVFTAIDADGNATAGGGVNYCEDRASGESGKPSVIARAQT